MNSPYNTKLKEITERLFPYTVWYPNRIYKQEDGYYVYKNTKGFIHILKPCKVKYNGEFSHYEITNYIVTKDGMMREVSSTGQYKTRDDCIIMIEKDMVKEYIDKDVY